MLQYRRQPSGCGPGEEGSADGLMEIIPVGNVLVQWIKWVGLQALTIPLQEGTMSPQPDVLIRIPSDWKGCGRRRLRRGVSGWYEDTYSCSVPAELNRQNAKAELISVGVDPVCLSVVLPSRPSPVPGWSAGFVPLVVCALLPSAAFLLPSLLRVKVPLIFVVKKDLSRSVSLHWSGFISLFCAWGSCGFSVHGSSSGLVFGLCGLSLCFFVFCFLFYSLPPDSDMRGALTVVLEHPSMLNLNCLLPPGCWRNRAGVVLQAECIFQGHLGLLFLCCASASGNKWVTAAVHWIFILTGLSV